MKRDVLVNFVHAHQKSVSMDAANQPSVYIDIQDVIIFISHNQKFKINIKCEFTTKIKMYICIYTQHVSKYTVSDINLYCLYEKMLKFKHQSFNPLNCKAK